VGCLRRQRIIFHPLGRFGCRGKFHHPQHDQHNWTRERGPVYDRPTTQNTGRIGIDMGLLRLDYHCLLYFLCTTPKSAQCFGKGQRFRNPQDGSRGTKRCYHGTKRSPSSCSWFIFLRRLALHAGCPRRL